MQLGTLLSFIVVLGVQISRANSQSSDDYDSYKSSGPSPGYRFSPRLPRRSFPGSSPGPFGAVEGNRYMRSNVGNRRSSPLLQTDASGENTQSDDLDCIPNDGSDTGEEHMGFNIGRGTNDDGPDPSHLMDTKKDDCYGVYSPRCSMFGRMTAGYKAELAEHDENGFRRRRQNPEYDPESDTYNSYPPGYSSNSHSYKPVRSTYPESGFGIDNGEIPDVNSHRFKRDLASVFGMDSGMGMGDGGRWQAMRTFSGMRSPVRRQTYPSSGGADYPDVGMSPSSSVIRPPRVGRVKCPERRVRPEYAYWKTGLSEEMRRREILKGSRKIGAIRHNQHIMGRAGTSDPFW